MAGQPGALLVNWLDLADGAALSFEHWHNREHAAERVSLPGFLRCRRYVSADRDQAPGFGRLIVYDAQSLDAFATDAYRERLDNPTALTRSVVPQLRAVSRALLSVERAWRLGQGGWMLTAICRRLPERDRLETTFHTLCDLPATTSVTWAPAPAEIRDAKAGTVEAGATESVAQPIAACLLVEVSTLAGVEDAASVVAREMPGLADSHIYRLAFTLEA